MEMSHGLLLFFFVCVILSVCLCVSVGWFGISLLNSLHNIMADWLRSCTLLHWYLSWSPLTGADCQAPGSCPWLADDRVCLCRFHGNTTNVLIKAASAKWNESPSQAPPFLLLDFFTPGSYRLIWCPVCLMKTKVGLQEGGEGGELLRFSNRD